MSRAGDSPGFAHRAVGAVRGLAKDSLWMLRGARLKTPPLARPLRSVLFVCHGNICRSPYAAVLAETLAADRGAPAIAWQSAGFAAVPGAASPDEAIAAARRDGVSLEAHRATRLDAAQVAAADLIVVFEVPHLLKLQAEYPASAGRFVLLPLLPPRRAVAFGYARYNVADPFGKPGPFFDACYARIRRDLTAFLDDLERSQP
jgi:protein-tyrosine-phosphatase